MMSYVVDLFGFVESHFSSYYNHKTKTLKYIIAHEIIFMIETKYDFVLPKLVTVINSAHLKVLLSFYSICYRIFLFLLSFDSKISIVTTSSQESKQLKCLASEITGSIHICGHHT